MDFSRVPVRRTLSHTEVSSTELSCCIPSDFIRREVMPTLSHSALSFALVTLE